MLCPSFGEYQFRNVLFTYVSWANKCQEKTLKILPSRAKSAFSLQCLAGCGGGESLVVWLLEVTYLSAESLHPSSPKMSRKQCCMSQHPDLGNLQNCEQTAEGSPVQSPRLGGPGLHHPPWLPVILEIAASFQDVLSPRLNRRHC